MSHDSFTQSEVNRVRVHHQTLLQHTDDSEFYHIWRRDLAKDWKTQIRVGKSSFLLDHMKKFTLKFVS